MLKIISDHHIEDHKHITPKFVSELIQANLTNLLLIIDSLLALSAAEAEEHIMIDLTPFTNQWHFSQYQRHQLHELLRRWQIHCASIEPLSIAADQKSATKVLQILTQRLENEASYLY